MMGAMLINVDFTDSNLTNINLKRSYIQKSKFKEYQTDSGHSQRDHHPGFHLHRCGHVPGGRKPAENQKLSF